jgi:Alcohol dehydrogenase GroES-like domain
MSTSTQTRNEPASRLKQQQSAPTSDVQSDPSTRPQEAMTYKAWFAKGAKQPIVLETVDLGPLGAEDVEVVVEHCGMCHSDLSVLNNAWGISQYPAILGHEVRFFLKSASSLMPASASPTMRKRTRQPQGLGIRGLPSCSHRLPRGGLS